MCVCGESQAGQWQRGIATPCRSLQGGPLGAGKAARVLANSSFFSGQPNHTAVEEGGGRPWAPSPLMDEGGGVWLLSPDSKPKAESSWDALSPGDVPMRPCGPPPHKPHWDFCSPPAQPPREPQWLPLPAGVGCCWGRAQPQMAAAAHVGRHLPSC